MCGRYCNSHYTPSHILTNLLRHGIGRILPYTCVCCATVCVHWSFTTVIQFVTYNYISLILQGHPRNSMPLLVCNSSRIVFCPGNSCSLSARSMRSSSAAVAMGVLMAYWVANVVAEAGLAGGSVERVLCGLTNDPSISCLRKSLFRSSADRDASNSVKCKRNIVMVANFAVFLMIAMIMTGALIIRSASWATWLRVFETNSSQNLHERFFIVGHGNVKPPVGSTRLGVGEFDD